MQAGKLALVAVAGLLLAGCADTPPAPGGDPGDPYEATNRQIFAANLDLDRMFLKRTAETYNRVVPEFGRERVHDLLRNLNLPVTFANDLLQGEPKRASQTFARFGVNSTIGLGGLFDPATADFAIPDHSEDFGQTLGVWGVGGDPYLMLPFLGPSSPRDVTGMAVDVGLDPMTWLHFKQHIWWQAGRQYFQVLDLRARNIDTLEGLERTSIDFYASTRSLYRQYRANEIRNGRPDTDNLPDL
jgi:phospholipid-binding lipoprotein MlaA